MNAPCWCVEMKLWVGSEWILIHRLSGCHRTVKPTRHPHIVQLAWHCVLVAASAGASPLALTNSHPATCGSTHKPSSSLVLTHPTSKGSATHLAPMRHTARRDLRCSSFLPAPLGTFITQQLLALSCLFKMRRSEDLFFLFWHMSISRLPPPREKEGA